MDAGIRHTGDNESTQLSERLSQARMVAKNFLTIVWRANLSKSGSIWLALFTPINKHCQEPFHKKSGLRLEKGGNGLFRNFVCRAKDAKKTEG